MANPAPKPTKATLIIPVIPRPIADTRKPRTRKAMVKWSLRKGTLWSNVWAWVSNNGTPIITTAAVITSLEVKNPVILDVLTFGIIFCKETILDS